MLLLDAIAETAFHLTEDRERARLFHTYASSSEDKDVYGAVLRILQRGEWASQEKASRVLCALIRERPTKASEGINGDAAYPALSAMLDWICQHMNKAQNTPSPIAGCQALASLAAEKPFRAAAIEAGVLQVIDILPQFY